MPATDETPLVSIVLPVHNGWRYLRDAVDSCLEQTYPRLELIIVDDASDDPKTAEILNSLAPSQPASPGPSIQIIRLDENVGLPHALNIGFRASRGELLSWTSDDNLYRPHAIETMVRAIADTGADFVYARASVIDEEGRIVGAIAPRPPWFLALENGVGACFLYTRRVMETVGEYDPDMLLTEDYDYWVRVSRRFRMECIDEDLYLYRTHGASLTGRHGRRRVEEMIDKVRRAHFSNAEIVRAQGLAAFARHDYPTARRHFFVALARRPWWFGLLRPLAIATLPTFLIDVVVALKHALFRRA